MKSISMFNVIWNFIRGMMFMYKFFQNLGRSLMLPVAVLPAAAIIVGIGHVLDALSILPQVAMFFTSVGKRYSNN